MTSIGGERLTTYGKRAAIQGAKLEKRVAVVEAHDRSLAASA